jgi:16S rRNA (guanine966-N2)-methyltransferase
MRIVGGQFRGRRLETPKDDRIRPTSDRAREAIFNLLSHNAPAALDGTSVLDLFAGSGALGFEALSRGAADVTFVDKESSSLALARRNADMLGVEDRARFVRSDIMRIGTAREASALVFCDAPYGKGLTQIALARALDNGWVADEATLVIEVGGEEDLVLPPALAVVTERVYGAATVVIAAYRSHQNISVPPT